MENRTLHLESVLQGTTGPESLEPLIRVLGFEPAAGPYRVSDPVPYGLGQGDAVRSMTTVGDHAGVSAILIEFDREFTPTETARIARRVRAQNAARPLFFLFAGPHYRSLGFASFGTGTEVRQLIIERESPRESDLETLAELAELAGREGEGAVQTLIRHARALDRTRLSRQFFRDFRAQRDRISIGWKGVPADLTTERDQLALLLLCRLLFLYFLQRQGFLNSDREYLPRLLNRWWRAERNGSFYQRVLRVLFFDTLNRRPEERDPGTEFLGPLPFLNGGLFEEHFLERRFPDLDLEDEHSASAFEDLLERYRFSAREPSEAEADQAHELGIDPEMLGRVFEELMAADRREASGTFFTPVDVVDRMVQQALEVWVQGDGPRPNDPGLSRLVRYGETRGIGPGQRLQLSERLAGIRVLDPAAGSGAFLLGALSRIARLRASIDSDSKDGAELRREIVGNSLYGVDLQDDAALLCALRLWLALALSSDSRAPEPLPNLDRKIRQGDALIDPIDLIYDDSVSTAAGASRSTWNSASRDAGVVRALRSISPLAERYLSVGPDERPGLQRELARAETRLARTWIDASLRYLRTQIAELDLLAGTRDLFDQPATRPQTAGAARQRLQKREAEIAELREALDLSGVIPFFSFDIHFADPEQRGFDLILSNPPWVRAHHWPAGLGRNIRQRYSVCQNAGWPNGTAIAGAPRAVGSQVDLSLLFLERSIRLLAPGGVSALLLPAKVLRALYGGGARRLVLRETEVLFLEDHSLDQRSIFRADAFAASLITRKRDVAEQLAQNSEGTDDTRPAVQVTMVRRGVEPLRFSISHDDLPLLPGDDAAPWLIAPPEVRSAIRKMQRAGPPLGEATGLVVRRGVATGANDVFLISDLEPKIGGLAWIRTEGYDRARRAGRPEVEAARFEAFIEGDSIRPLVRGSSISAWRYETGTSLIWLHDDVDARPSEAPTRTARFLARHETRLRARSGWSNSMPVGSIFRTSPFTTGPKVAWQDLSDNLNAVAIPARVASGNGRKVPVIPLNTVYFIPTESYDQALRMSAILNSLPLRTFARSIAERAKDARFRFLAWSIALLPITQGWEETEYGERLIRIARTAHQDGGLDLEGRRYLDETVASIYGLSGTELEAIRNFDRWLQGRS